MTDSAPDSGTSARPHTGTRLDSWKEIAVYLRRDESTVRRWEKAEGLPVHRHVHERRASVFAYRHELDAWLERRDDVDLAREGQGHERVADPARGGTMRRLPLLKSAGVLVIVVLGIWLTWDGVIRRAPVPPAGSHRLLIADPNPQVQPASVSGRASVRTVLEREIVDASDIDVVARGEIAGALRLMRRPVSTTIDEAIAREVALRNGDIDAVITWRVELRGDTRQVVLSLRDSLDGGLIASWQEAATADITSAVERMARRIAPELEGLLDTLEPRKGRVMPFLGMEGMRLEDVTTASFETWRLYVEAMTRHFAFQWRQSAELLERAVTADPEFATAHAFLGRAYTSSREWDNATASYQRAFELADGVTERERYFILAGYFEHVLRDPNRTADAYSTLLLSYPDHYWGVTYASWFHFAHGGLSRVIEYTRRYADARPEHLEMTIEAARELGAWGNSPEWANQYVDRARNLLPESIPDLLARPESAGLTSTGSAAWLALRDVYDRWRVADVESALEALRQLEVSAHPRFAPWLGRAYLALGRLRDAERVFSGLELDDLHRHEGLVAVALVRNDQQTFRRHLVEIGGRARGWLAVLRVRESLYSPDEWPLNGAPGAAGAPVVRGAIALRDGRTEDAIALLEGALPRLHAAREEMYYVALESLALAWQRAGDVGRAVETLEATRGARPQAAFGAWYRPLLWLRTQAQLADLYRELGQYDDAGAVEAEIAALLRVADPDHALLARSVQ